MLVDIGECKRETRLHMARADVLMAGVTIAQTPSAEGRAGVASYEAARVGDSHAELEGGRGEVFLRR